MPVVELNDCPTFAVPTMVGGVMSTGGPGSTNAPCSEVAGAEGPAEFEAVTVTRNVEPTSSEPIRYVCAVAPEIAEQLAPFASQRCHW